MMGEEPRMEGWQRVVMALAITWPILAALGYALYAEVLHGR